MNPIDHRPQVLEARNPYLGSGHERGDRARPTGDAIRGRSEANR